jgi:hypothetical protein
MAETGPPPPPPPPDIGIPPLAEEALILVLDSIFPGLGELVVAVIWVIEQIVNFLTDAFSGVPHEAKTIGTAGQLIHAKDAILQYFGIQMMAGAANGRVLSESGAVTFEEQLSHATGGLISWANYQPLGSYWPSNFTVNKATGKADYLLKPVPPPKGAPYNQDVRPFVAAWPPMTPQDYQARYGKPPPDLIDAGLFLQSGRTPKFNTKEIRQSIRQKDFDQAVKIWLTEYQKWVDDGRPGFIPAPPRPDKGKGNIIFDPEMIAIVDRVRLCICEIDTAFTPLANALTPLLQLLDAAALVEIENCLCGNLTRIAAGIEKLAPADLKANLDRIAKAVEPDAGAVAAFKVLLDELAKDGVIDSQLAQSLSV